MTTQPRKKELFPGIVSDSEIDGGRPVIEGTRVRVDIILGHLGAGMSIDEICYEYDLTENQVRTAIKYAVTLVPTR
jgi:uncharacterized protein (DUF433 family)